MTSSVTIKLFLPRHDRSLCTAEIVNWTGKAIAAPRAELEDLLARLELDKAGVYILIGSDPLTNKPRAYIGEAEVIRERLKQQKTKEFWVAAIVFVSKDENLTKAHVRYLEAKLLAEAAKVGRFTLEQNEAGGSRLPESDLGDMEVFFSRMRQLLPHLGPGSDILVPIVQSPNPMDLSDCYEGMIQHRMAEQGETRGVAAKAVAQTSGRSWSLVYQLLKLQAASADVKQACRDGLINAWNAIAIARCTPDEQPAVLKHCLEENPSVKRLKKWIALNLRPDLARGRGERHRTMARRSGA